MIFFFCKYGTILKSGCFVTWKKIVCLGLGKARCLVFLTDNFIYLSLKQPEAMSRFRNVTLINKAS